MSPAVKVVALAFTLVFLSACSSLSSLSPFDNTSPAPLHVALSFVPAAADGGALQNSALHIQLDAYPDPATVASGTVSLRSGGLPVDANLRVDLVGQTVLLTPANELPPGGYQLVVSSVASLDHRLLPAPSTFDFTVETGEGVVPPTPAPLTWAHDIGPTLSTCSPYCHSPTNVNGAPQTPTRSLDLTGNFRDPVFGLVDVESTGQEAVGRPMLRVAPGDSANSVLLRKLLGGEPVPGRTTAPYPEMGIVGQRMPLNLSTMISATPLDPAFIALVEQWIDQGAN